ncbi:hypothetical protein WKI68_11310 [Streptomyces sp. MS1.HAVA.3]|uniref:DUF732 domain-containing protein n=1 Tax=Streptomyces caledonius TaxID=3134107 RepID=A0ABU8U202_9ACTN
MSTPPSPDHIPPQPEQPPAYGYPQPGSLAPAPEPKKPLSTGKKIGIGVGGTLGLVLLAAVFGAVAGIVQDRAADGLNNAAAPTTTAPATPSKAPEPFAPQPTPTPVPTPTPTPTPTVDPSLKAALASALAPAIAEQQWNKMTAADQKEMCDAYETLGPNLVKAMFVSGIKPGTEGYEYKDVLGDAFIAVLAKRCI